MGKEYDVVIIGGGVVGSSIAYHLSEVQKEGIAVIDGGFPMCEASGANQGWVWVHKKRPAWYCELSYYSAELYKYLDRKVGDVEYKRTGGIAPFFNEQEKEAAYQLAEEQAQVGVRVDVLTRDEALEREPVLSSKIIGATYCEIDGNVNPMRLVDQYMRTAKRQGVTYESYNKVIGLERKQGGFQVQTQNGDFFCRRLVLSAGLYTKELGKMLNISIPVRPVQGQVIITEPLTPLLRHTLAAMRQTYNGEILMGFSHDEVGFDDTTTLDCISQAAQLAVKLVPCLAQAKVVRSFSGLRVMPADGHPIMSEVETIEGLYVAAMHSGVTLSPLAGTLMTQLITGEETELPMDRFSLKRFA